MFEISRSVCVCVCVCVCVRTLAYFFSFVILGTQWAFYSGDTSPLVLGSFLSFIYLIISSLKIWGFSFLFSPPGLAMRQAFYLLGPLVLSFSSIVHVFVFTSEFFETSSRMTLPSCWKKNKEKIITFCWCISLF